MGKPSSVWLLLLSRALLQGRASQLSFNTYVLIGCSVMSAFPLAVQLPHSSNGVPLEYLALPLTTAEAWTSLPQIIFFPSGGTWAGRMGVRVGCHSSENNVCLSCIVPLAYSKLYEL